MSREQVELGEAKPEGRILKAERRIEEPKSLLEYLLEYLLENLVEAGRRTDSGAALNRQGVASP